MGLSAVNAKALEARGIDLELASSLGIADADRSGFDIKFPYFSGGVVVNHKYRTLGEDKRFAQDKDAKKCFYNLDCLMDSSIEGPVIITEGEFDALIAMQCGYPLVISVPDGAPSESIDDPASLKYTYVQDAEALLSRFKEIILCTDGDGPGLNLRNDLATRLGKTRCKWVPYPKGTKDLNEVFKRWGEKGVQSVFDRAKWWDIAGIFRLADLPPLPVADRFSTGLEGMDAHYNIRPGDLAVLTGMPSTGKSTFINSIVMHVCRTYGWRVAMASFEQRPQLDHRRNLRTMFHGKMERDMSMEEIEEADAWINKHILFIVPAEDDDVTIDWVLEKASAAVVRHNCKFIAIDPWNEMDHHREPGQSETEYTGVAIKRFKKFVSKHWIHMMIAAHPAKMQRNKSGKMPKVSMYDIAGSAHWYNKPDVGIVLHKDQDRVVVEIAKSKYHDQIGYPGEIPYSFNLTTGVYSAIPEEMI